MLTAVGFAADDASDNQSTLFSQERQFSVAQKIQNDGLYENALKLWNDFLKKHPQSPLALAAKNNRGLCNYKLQKYEDAKRDLDEVLNSGKKLNHKDETLLFCGLCAQNLSETNPALAQDAKNRLETLLKEFPDSDYAILAKFSLAKVYEQLNNLNEAKKLYIDIWKNSPNNPDAPEAYLQTGNILFNQKDYDICLKLALGFSKKWNQQPEVYSAAVLAGNALFMTGDFEQAEKQYAFASNPKAEGIEKFNQMDYAMNQRGKCLLQLQNYEKAAQAFSDVISQFPKSDFVPMATFDCGYANWKNNNVQKAKEYFVKATEFDEFKPKANQNLSEIYLKENDLDNAIKRIDMVPELQFKCLPGEPEAKQKEVCNACMLKAQIYSKSNDPQRLQDCVKICDRISLQWPNSPSAPWAVLLAAKTEFLQNNYDNAVSLCNKIQTQWKDSPYNLESQRLKADCLLKTNKFKEAAELFYSLYQNNPNDSRQYIWLIRTCEMYDKLQRFDIIYKILPNEYQNIKSDELRPLALYLIGKSACELNKDENALKYLQFCQKRYPNFSGMDNILFYQGVILTRQKDYENALKMFQSILDNYPNSSAKQKTVSYMTQLYRMTGKFDVALEQADKIISQNKDSQYRPSAILDSLGILTNKENWDQALKLCDLFIKDYPQHEGVTEAYQYRGYCYFKLQKFPEAISDCRQGLTIAKQKDQLDKWELPLRKIEVSSLAKQDGKIDETQTAFEAFMEAKQRLGISISNEDAVIYLYANALFKAGKRVDAVKQYKYLFDNYKTSPYCYECAFSIGEFAANSNQINASKKYLDFAVNGPQPPAAIKAAHKLGWIFYDQKNYEDAFKWFTHAVSVYDAAKDSQLPVIQETALSSRIMAADCLYWQKKYPQALAMYKTLPNLPVQFQALATVHAAECAFNTNDYNLASKLIDKVLDNKNVIVPELAQESKKWEPALQFIRARIWFETNNRDKAEELFDQIVKDNADASPKTISEASFLSIIKSWQYLGELMFDKGNFKEAIVNFYIAIDVGEKNLDLQEMPELMGIAYYEAGRCFESLKQISKARKMYQTILDKYPNCSKAQVARIKLQQLK